MPLTENRRHLCNRNKERQGASQQTTTGAAARATHIAKRTNALLHKLIYSDGRDLVRTARLRMYQQPPDGEGRQQGTGRGVIPHPSALSSGPPITTNIFEHHLYSLFNQFANVSCNSAASGAANSEREFTRELTDGQSRGTNVTRTRRGGHRRSSVTKWVVSRSPRRCNGPFRPNRSSARPQISTTNDRRYEPVLLLLLVTHVVNCGHNHSWTSASDARTSIGPRGPKTIVIGSASSDSIPRQCRGPDPKYHYQRRRRPANTQCSIIRAPEKRATTHAERCE